MNYLTFHLLVDLRVYLLVNSCVEAGERERERERERRAESTFHCICESWCIASLEELTLGILGNSPVFLERQSVLLIYKICLPPAVGSLGFIASVKHMKYLYIKSELLWNGVNRK